MRLLLDTHLLLWALAEPDRLAAKVRAAIEDPSNDVLFSSASIWEIAIKASLRRPDFNIDPSDVLQGALETGFEELPADGIAASRVLDLPMHHRDPFDRLLVAQAMSEPARLFTADPLLKPYSELVTLV